MNLDWHDLSSNINEVIRAVLNFLLFFTKIFRTHQKAPKSTKSTKSTKTQRNKNANKQTKIKNTLKKHIRGGSNLFAYLRFCVFVQAKKRK